jgi:hypothetical protein
MELLMKAKLPKNVTLKNGKDLIFQKRIPSNILLKSNTKGNIKN